MLVMKLVGTGAASFAGALVVGVVATTGREVKRSGEDLIRIEAQLDSFRVAMAQAVPAFANARGRANVVTDFNEDVDLPTVDATAFIDPFANVLGHVQIGRDVYVGPFASIRGDEGQPIHVGDGANVQDGVVVHALETVQEGEPVAGRTYNVGGKNYAVYIGKRVSLAHQALVHGPARVDDNVFIGMQAMVFKAAVGEGVVIEPGAKVIGVTIPPHRYVPAGQTVTDQRVADALPQITDNYPFRSLNDAVVHVNTSFAAGYSARVAALVDSIRGHPAVAAGSPKAADHQAPRTPAKEPNGGEKKH
jgi:carbonic anhydrase/acetyltransferase-like protein (isoleucine patch superfamily)